MEMQTDQCIICRKTWKEHGFCSKFQHREYDSSKKLDEEIVLRLESQIPDKAKALLKYLKGKKHISYWNRRKHSWQKQVHAFTEGSGNSSFIWLDPNHSEVLDSLVHEIGQVWLQDLRFKGLKPADSSDSRKQEENWYLVSFASNAFLTPILEKKLEAYGIDRSRHRRRSFDGFAKLLRELPPNHAPAWRKSKSPVDRALLCGRYVSSRLLLGEEFEELEKIWQKKMIFVEIRTQAKQIYNEALKGYQTPDKYTRLQRYFLKILDLKDAAK